MRITKKIKKNYDELRAHYTDEKWMALITSITEENPNWRPISLLHTIRVREGEQYALGKKALK